MPRTSPAPDASCRGCSQRARSLRAIAAACVVALVATGAARAADLGALDCARAETYAAASLPNDRAPHVVLLQGSLGIVTMAPLGTFLAAMGYPAQALTDPRTGQMTVDSDVDARALAGMLAWLYERDGVRPVLVGHSKGGGVVIDTLRALAGTYGTDLAIVDPRTHAAEPRTLFVDPVTGASARVVDLVVPYATAIATGRLLRYLRGQVDLARVLRDVPDSVEAFTGFTIPFDPIAGAFAGDEDPYRATGRASVRNVVLPATTSHIAAPRTEHLARDPVIRAWIDRYRPGSTEPPPAEGDTMHLALAAELWFDLKRAWCAEAKRAAKAAARR